MNNKIMIAIIAVICSVLIFGIAIYVTLRFQDTSPQLKSTIVVPDDFPTISDAIDNATEGDTVFVKKGTYEISEYSVVINKTISIIGEDQANTILVFPPDTRTGYEFLISKVGFRVYADNFKISSLTIMNCDFGVSVSGNGTEVSNTIMDGVWLIGSYSKIFDINITDALSESNSFTNFFTITGSYNNISRNSIDNLVDGECQGSFNKITENTIKGGINLKGSSNIITNNSFRSMTLTSSDSNIIKNNTFNHLCLYRSSHNTILGNTAQGPGYHNGILLSSGSGNVFYGNYIADYNGTSTFTGRQYGYAVDIGSMAENNLFYHNNFVNNYVNLMYSWNPEMSNSNYWDNEKEGNYWSNYNGVDVDGDGIGDTPYSIYYKNVDYYPLMEPFDIDSVTVELPEWASPPSVCLISPENMVYTSADVTLEFTINKQTSWMGYSLDGQETVTITGNTTLSGLSSDSHSVTVYAKGLLGNMGNSDTIWFNVAESFSTVPVAVTSVAAIVFVGVGLIVYFKKRNS